MKKTALFLIIAALITSCSRVDLSKDETAMSYIISYDFSQTQQSDKKNIKLIKQAVYDYPDKNPGLEREQVYSAYFNHLEEIKKNNIIIDRKAYIKGVIDSLNSQNPAIKPERINIIRNRYYNIISSKITVKTPEFEKSLKKRSDLISTKNGLFYKIIRQGSGPTPADSDRVTVHMIGSLPGGYEFSNTRIKQRPVQFYLKKTIKGMNEGIQLMKTGSHYIFYIPPKLAYGNKQKGIIPADSYIIYEIELLNVEK
ncbi:MAG TPA: FKBP-type peptidyl-prolyl cis-trans isomerase [Spirochaetota bacterium]|nr:FKBP-type peptidyl-prolyl cis-trans isomerase [Spirochaetota bacterium]HPJ36427.1 FKBP-type peptidyl-prolyl cis-trans isomerase [Spirochaetota bacterium]